MAKKPTKAQRKILKAILEDSDSPGGASNLDGVAVTEDQLLLVANRVLAGNADMLIAYQTAILAEQNFSNPPTLAQVQALIDTVNNENMPHLFEWDTTFNDSYVVDWDVSRVTDMTDMFEGARAFKQDISGWKVGNVTKMAYMFNNAFAFNQDIGGWKVGNVTNMAYMFESAKAFNQDISGWDVSQVKTMEGMFTEANNFNQNINGWTVSQVKKMGYMFWDAKVFNQDIGGWDVSQVKDMEGMFLNARVFNQDIGGWDISSLTEADRMLNGSGMSQENFDKLLAGWSTLDTAAGETQINSNVKMGASGRTYTDATSHNRLTDTYGWTIGGASLADTVTKGTNGDDQGADALGNDGLDTQQIIHGLDGDDTLTGGGGDDILVGGAGNDTLTGGAGADRFVYKYDDDGQDIIMDFDIDEDILDLTQLLIGITDQNHDLGDYITVSKSDDDTVLLTIDHDGDDTGNKVTINFNSIPYGSIDPATFLDDLNINYNRPTAITLDGATINEDVTDGGDLATTSVNSAVLVGTLTTVDADEAESFTYAIEDVPNTDGALFTLLEGQSSAQLHFKGNADFETQDSYQVAIRVIDQYGNSQVEMLTIEVTDVSGSYKGTKRANSATGSSEEDVMRGKKGKDVLNGADGDDILNGGGGADILDGGLGADTLSGAGGNDTLIGGAGADVLVGGTGADHLIGGDLLTDDGAADVFKFTNAHHIGKKAGSRDIIEYFDQSDGDQIDFSGIDAKTGRGGNQAFSFIADAAFSGTKGELRFETLTSGETLVMGDVNGDGKADFKLQIDGVFQALTETDFIL